MELNNILTEQLVVLRSQFVARGFDLRLVGGCVRDLLAGVKPNDIDLCTDADPDEQVAMYHELGVRYIETGLQHGTVTVVLDGETYEITSLRRDAETDGRHAKVVYTRDWRIDAARRDFTINAMSLTFDGELFDPFGGADDLKAGVVAFVGVAEDRIREDYLRILRWFRFRGRYGSSLVHMIDQPAWKAVFSLSHGLTSISRERVWSELSKTLAGPNGVRLVGYEMQNMGVARYCSLPDTDIINLVDYAADVHEISRNPVTLLVALYGVDAINILVNLKASRAEINLASWLDDTWTKFDVLPSRYMAVHGVCREWAVELGALRLMGPFELAILRDWVAPSFPVTGYDLLAAGVPVGPAVGKMIADLKTIWGDSGYSMTKHQLLALV